MKTTRIAAIGKQTKTEIPSTPRNSKKETIGVSSFAFSANLFNGQTLLNSFYDTIDFSPRFSTTSRQEASIANQFPMRDAMRQALVFPEATFAAN